MALFLLGLKWHSRTMTEEEFRREAGNLEKRLRQGFPLDRDGQILLLAALLLKAETRRDQKYGHP